MKNIITKFLHRSWYQQCLLIGLVAFSYIQLSGLVGTKIIVPAVGWGSGYQQAGTETDPLEERFVRWDSNYYLRIAEDGYRVDGTERAFFPLYPLFTRAITNGLGLSLLWSGWLISIGCFLAASLILYQWVKIEYDSSIALWSISWFYFFPLSFFFVAFYPEALFLLLSISSLYLARRGQFIASGLLIALAGAARPVAFLLAIPFIIEFLQQNNFSWKRWLKFGAGALLAPCGTLVFLLFLSWQAGSQNPISVYTSNLDREWKMSTVWPWITWQDGLTSALFGTDINHDWFARVEVWHDLLYALLGLGLAIWGIGNLRPSLAAFMVASMLFFYTQHGPYGYAFDSMPRHVASIFPIYFALPILTNKLPPLYRGLLIILSGILLGILSSWFASGRWVS